jgi:hypothetical protein
VSGERTKTARRERNARAAVKTEDDAQWAGGAGRADKEGVQRAGRVRGDQDRARRAVGGRSAASGQGRAASGMCGRRSRQSTACSGRAEQGELTRTACSERDACAAIKTEHGVQWAGGARRAGKDGQQAECVGSDQDRARRAVGGRSRAS